MYFTDYIEGKILNTLLGVTMTAIAEVYFDLLVSAPNEDGTGAVPISYSGYTRELVTFSTPAAMSGGFGIQNDVEIEFAQSAADAGTCTYVAAYDSLTGGNMLFYGPLNTSKVIKAGTAPIIRAGEAKFWMTGSFSLSFMARILNVFRGASGSSITGFTPYATLFNGDPQQGGSELTGGSFARQAITFGTPAAASSGQMQVANTAAVSFPVATSNLGSYSYDAIYDAASGGNLISLKVGTSDTYSKGDLTKYPIGSLVVGVN
jgi:hypothetical protein